jgi:AcrR family transcriptional regulator
MHRRAELVDQTRLRITEATVRLHTTVGPARTSIAAVAEEAGVTRLTVYRHFSDLDALFEACTAHWMAQNPPPDPAAWSAIPSVEGRARRGFGELYGWYRDHGEELYPIYRDMAAMPAAARRKTEDRWRTLADALLGVSASSGNSSDGEERLLRAVALHLVDFRTWHSLVTQQDLDDREVVELAVGLLTAVHGS